jgi:hypothetical protein
MYAVKITDRQGAGRSCFGIGKSAKYLHTGRIRNCRKTLDYKGILRYFPEEPPLAYGKQIKTAHISSRKRCNAGFPVAQSE